MTATKDAEEGQSNPSVNSRAYAGQEPVKLSAAPQSEARSSSGIGSSHTKISFVNADNPDLSWETYPRHRSPPPDYNDGGGWTQDFATDSYDPNYSGNADPFGLLEDEQNEKLWWNAPNRAALKPLGPGLLPVLAASKMHAESHGLVKVSVTIPDFSGPSQNENAFRLPTADEVRQAVPHQNAFYCPKCNAWIIVQKTRMLQPPVYPEYPDNCKEMNYPSTRAFSRSVECNTQTLSSLTYNNAPEVHHYHLYEDAIPSTSIVPPFKRQSWEVEAPLPRKVFSHHIAPPKETFWSAPSTVMLEIEANAQHPGIIHGVDYLDLYACCRCMTNIYVTRRPIPGVVSPRLLADLRRERLSDSRGAIQLVLALEFVLKMLEFLIWKGENRAMNIEGKAFQKSFGADAQAMQIWKELGYTIDQEKKHLIPPVIESEEQLHLLLRAWVELSAYTADYIRANPSTTAYRQREGTVIHKVWVKVNSASDEIADLIGSHPNQIPRGLIDAPQPAYDKYFHDLGLTQSSYTPNLLVYAYKQQTKCDITHLPLHLESLRMLLDVILPQLKREDPLINEEIRELITVERSKGRWVPGEYEEALTTLQIGEDSPLLLDIYEVDANFLESAYKSQLLETWKPAIIISNDWSEDVKRGMEPNERRQQLKEAVRIAAEGAGRDDLYQVFKKISEPWSSMDPDKAYTALGVPKETSDEMLMTVFGLRVEDAPSQTERMREALQVLGEFRNSSRIREFLRSGIDPGEEGTVIQPEWPRGLNQLGNTCYLNSLLQYFYTIKDLRQEILAKSPEELFQLIGKEKLSDAQLQKHRVGGRLVTRKEIERSRQFLAHLSELFTQMACANANAITPSIELAKLALVTSKDEEEDAAKANPQAPEGTSSSASTDATLVEDTNASLQVTLSTDLSVPASTSAASSTQPNPAKILGKRSREADTSDHDGEISSDVDMATHKVRSPRREDSSPPDKTMRVDGPSEINLDSDGIETEKLVNGDEDVNMDDVEVSSMIVTAPVSRSGSPTTSGNAIPASETRNQPPPLPKRQPPPLPPRKQPISDSTMMFGKQHDVSECMDNCMFQIETALLDFDGQSVTDSDKTSVVKRLFYGKIRQKITVLPTESSSNSKPAVNEKEDLFSHLPVNVSEEGFDLYDGLGGYFHDNVEFESKKATMEVSLVDLPPILQIQLQRVQFNRETLQPYKNQSYLKFGESLFMDRYLEDANPEKRLQSKEIQSKLTACRDRIGILTQGQGMPIIDALKGTAQFLDSQPVAELLEREGINDFLAETVRYEAIQLEEELKLLRNEVVQLKHQLEDLWKDEQLAEYELTSVFIHRGSSPSWGHYFFYARNLPDKADEWFKYNDSTVSMARKEEVLADTTGSTANPYLLVYARKGSGVVQTVNRQM